MVSILEKIELIITSPHFIQVSYSGLAMMRMYRDSSPRNDYQARNAIYCLYTLTCPFCSNKNRPSSWYVSKDKNISYIRVRNPCFNRIFFKTDKCSRFTNNVANLVLRKMASLNKSWHDVWTFRTMQMRVYILVTTGAKKGSICLGENI